jgi:glyoxylase-like metal-dependent hydrolase (beta-lactamase superfamily II)
MDQLIQTFRLGDWEVAGFVESFFGLDGGSMFGVVPKIMWQKLLPPDDENRVPMQTNLFVVKTGEYNILLDTGLGDALSDFDRKVYAPKGKSRMDEALNAIGVPPEKITHVVFTHLHTDHSNGAFVGDPENPQLRFPNATHYVQKQEWTDAMTPNERTDAVYLRNRLQVLADNGKLVQLDGDAEIVPGVEVRRTGGHTGGHQGVEVVSNGERFVYYADIIPTRFHLKGPYVAAVDLFPLETMKFKRAFLERCCETRTVVGFDHDVEVMFGRIVRKKKWMDVVPIDVVSVSANS